MPPRGASRLLPPALALTVALAAAPAHAFDPFEIQVYDGATNQPGEASLELHTNYHHAPSRPVPEGPELPTGKQLHFTLEPALGVTSFWELGLNYEVGFLPSRFDADRYGAEIRPIVGFEAQYVKLAVNPNVEVGFAGQGLRDGPDFTPAGALYGRIPDVLELGVEYYASTGPMKHVPRWSAQEHYLFAAANLLALEGWELNAGAGFGLTENSDAFIAKVIVGHSIGRLWGKERGQVATGSPVRMLARR